MALKKVLEDLFASSKKGEVVKLLLFSVRESRFVDVPLHDEVLLDGGFLALVIVEPFLTQIHAVTYYNFAKKLSD